MSHPGGPGKGFLQVLDFQVFFLPLNFRAEFESAYGSKTWGALFTLGHNVIHKICVKPGSPADAQKLFNGNFWLRINDLTRGNPHCSHLFPQKL